MLEHNDTPAMNPKTTPILLLDLWEHAYYLDVRFRSTNETPYIVGTQDGSGDRVFYCFYSRLVLCSHAPMRDPSGVAHTFCYCWTKDGGDVKRGL